MLRITTRAMITLATTVCAGACNLEGAAERETANMATAPQDITVESRDGTEISYDKVGSGPVLIVVTAPANSERPIPSPPNSHTSCLTSSRSSTMIVVGAA
jgi:hypothetical protein